MKIPLLFLNLLKHRGLKKGLFGLVLLGALGGSYRHHLQIQKKLLQLCVQEVPAQGVMKKYHILGTLRRIPRRPSSFWVIEQAQVRQAPGSKEEVFSLPQAVMLNGDFSQMKGWEGREIEVRGEVSCTFDFQNGHTSIRSPRLRLRLKSPIQDAPSNSSWLMKMRRWFFLHALGPWKPYPKLYGYLYAVWTGSEKELHPTLQEFYQKSGMLHLLALSGQHVVILVGMTEFFLVCFCRLLPLRLLKSFPFIYFEILMPLAVAGLLWLTSWATPSVMRTAVMLSVGLFSKRMGIYVPPLHALGLGGCYLVMSDFWLLHSLSLFLSCACTLGVLVLLSGYSFSSKFHAYLFATLVFPCLALPLSMYCFGTLSLGSVLWGIILSGVWEWVLIPLGYGMLPLLHFLEKLRLGAWLSQHWEMMWGHFELWHVGLLKMTQGVFFHTPQLGGFEWCVLSFTLAIGLKRIRCYF